VIVKAKDVYSVSLSWILNTLGFMDTMYDNYVESPSPELLVTDDKTKKEWRFSDLRRTDDFGIHLMLALFQASEKKVMLQWMPHPWFEVIHHEQDIRFQNALRMSGAVIHVIVGGRTYLDRDYTDAWPEDVYKYSLAVSPFENDRRSYLMVIDDYLLTVKFDQKTAATVDSFFDRVRSAEELNVSEAVRLFDQQGDVRVILEKNRKKTKGLKRKFCKFWGFREEDV